MSAYLQHSTLDGLVPLGVDHVVPGAEPTTDLALVGVESVGEAVDDPHAPQLRLLAPGDEAGTARVTVYGEDGAVPLRGAEEVEITPGVVTDLSLGGLPAGAYAVSVHADVPVVGGASVDRRGEPDPDLLHEERQYDRAWLAARPLPPVEDTDPVDESTGSTDAASRAGQVALVPGTSSALTLAAVPAAHADEDADEPAGSLELLVRVYDESGTEAGTTTLTLRAGTTQTLDPATVRAEGPRPSPRR